jgi:hypothetical protein
MGQLSFNRTLRCNILSEQFDQTIKPESQKEVLFASTTKGFILSGASSAANFAAMLSIRARDDALFKENRPTGVILQIPNTCDASFYPEKFVFSFRAQLMNHSDG